MNLRSCRYLSVGNNLTRNELRLSLTKQILVAIYTGFIDFIVDPTFSLLMEMAEKIVIPLVEENPGPPDPCNRHR